MRSSRRPTRSISASRRVCLAFSRRLRSGLSCCCGEYPGQTCSRTARDHTRRQLTQRMQSRSVVPGPANVPIKRGGLRLAILHAQARAHKALAQPHIYIWMHREALRARPRANRGPTAPRQNPRGIPHISSSCPRLAPPHPQKSKDTTGAQDGRRHSSHAVSCATLRVGHSASVHTLIRHRQ